MPRSPRTIRDQGPQFIARHFQEFIRPSGMTPVRASPFYPQSNGKTRGGHASLQGEGARPGVLPGGRGGLLLGRPVSEPCQSGASARRERQPLPGGGAINIKGDLRTNEMWSLRNPVDLPRLLTLPCRG